MIIISVIIVIISGITLIRHYLNVPQNKYQERLVQLDKLIKEGLTTQAVYDTVYEELKRKGHRQAIFINYIYCVNDKHYKKERQMQNPPDKFVFDLVYLPEDPNIHALNPKEEYENYMGLLQEEKKTPTISWILFFVSVGYLTYLIITIRNEKKLENEFQSIMQK